MRHNHKHNEQCVISQGLEHLIIALRVDHLGIRLVAHSMVIVKATGPVRLEMEKNYCVAAAGNKEVLFWNGKRGIKR